MPQKKAFKERPAARRLDRETEQDQGPRPEVREDVRRTWWPEDR